MTSTSTALKQVFDAGRPLVKQWLEIAELMNGHFMDAWRRGNIDQVWRSYHEACPAMYLLYYIRERGLGDIKIGKTRNLGERIRTMCTYAPRGADLIACYPALAAHERELKDEFQHLRLCGEWFRMGAELKRHLILIGVDTSNFTNEVASSDARKNMGKAQ